MTNQRFLKSVVLTFTLLLSTSPLFGQTKNEKETRISGAEFPEKAQHILKLLPENCKKLRFYKETDGDKQSYEVKFKYNKKRYSLEFSKNGIIEDIEVITKFKNINEATKTEIKFYFNSSYTKHKFIKIQRQFVYTNNSNAHNFITEVLSSSTKTSNFEIIAEVKSKKNRNIKEFTFNDRGTLLSYRILNPTSYEHVLY